jgi:hypothetical protein
MCKSIQRSQKLRNKLILSLSAAAFVVAVMLIPSAASAAGCPAGQEGTPPYCKTSPPPPVCPAGQTGTPPNCVTPPPATCATGQVGTPPNCVTPKLEVKTVKVTSGGVTLTLNVNAPGTVKITGSGVKSKTTSVTAGTVKIKVSLTSQEKKVLTRRARSSSS